MDGGQIERGLKGVIKNGRGGPIFAGVYLADGIKYFTQYYYRSFPSPVVGIFNTLGSNSDPLSIGHWICIYKSSRRLAYLDSYAQDPLNYSPNFKELEKWDVPIYKNEFALQNLYSNVCGLYCMYFVHNITRYGLDETLKLMSKTFSPSNPSGNDEWITRYAYNNFALPPCNRIGFSTCE